MAPIMEETPPISVSDVAVGPSTPRLDCPWPTPMVVTFTSTFPGELPCSRACASQAGSRKGAPGGSTSGKRPHGRAAAAAARPSGCMLNGPCRHCGTTYSPQWRKGTHDKPVLCNACGIRLRRHKCLDESTAHKGPLPPMPPPPPPPPAEEDEQQDASSSGRSSQPVLVLLVKPGPGGKPSLLPATSLVKADAPPAAGLQQSADGDGGRMVFTLGLPGPTKETNDAAREGSSDAEAADGVSSGSDGSCMDGACGGCGLGGLVCPGQCGQALVLLHNGWPQVDGKAMDPDGVAEAIAAALAAAATETAPAAGTAAKDAAEASKEGATAAAAGGDVAMCVVTEDAPVLEEAALGVPTPAAMEVDTVGKCATPIEEPEDHATEFIEAVEPPAKRQRQEVQQQEQQPSSIAAPTAAVAAADATAAPVQSREEQQQAEHIAQRSPSSGSSSGSDDGSSEDEAVVAAAAVAAKAAASVLLVRSMEATTCMPDGAARLLVPQSVMA